MRFFAICGILKEKHTAQVILEGGGDDMADISGNLLQVEENDYRILGTPSVVAKKTFFYLQETGI